MSRFTELTPQQNFVNLEKEILDYWNSQEIFQKTLQNSERCPKPTFLFYDGPPFATGLPHYGHILASVIKDTICRFKTMQGFVVPRKFGWDCHGLPVEMEVQKSLNLTTSADIESFGIYKFNQNCKSIVDKYTSEWKSTITRIGRWIDMENPYKTMDTSFMESVWWCFAQLFKKELIYEGFKILPYSWKAGTSLSNFEANLNYKMVQDPSVVVEFPLKENPHISFLAWTTTPWTLPSNMSLCVHPKQIYVQILDSVRNRKFILAKDCVEKIFSQNNQSPSYSIQQTFIGEELSKISYIPLYEFGKKNGFIHHIVTDDYVSTENGTGIVHQAPAYGEDDYRVCSSYKIPYIDLLDSAGCFISGVGELSGLFFQNANKVVIKYIKQLQRLFHQSTIEHSYPHCWRTDTPLLYKGMSTWFVCVESFKKELTQNNKLINWIPQHIKEGRFGKWLLEAKDWDVGRNRFWGTPVPIWKSSQNDLLCIGSIQELQNLSGKTVTDLHRHYIDDITIEKDGKIYKRVHQILDCWFESGSMPYAQKHYPFENKMLVDSQLPAHFIAEGLDQTRGWFYTLLVLSTALQNKPPVQNILVTGLVLAEDGQKMSKRLKNYPEPSVILETYGADALRLYLFNSGVVHGDALKFSSDDVQETLRNIILPLWNALYFFTTYANIDGFSLENTTTTNKNTTPIHWTDRWIISVCQLFVKDVTLALQTYELQKTIFYIESFIDKLTNWYIRLNRRRFWKEENDDDKWAAYACLYDVLKTVCQTIAPITPFLSEKMFHILQQSNQESVHTQLYPCAKDDLVDQNLVDTMNFLEVIVKLGRSLRSSAKIKNRQPLPAATIICTDTQKCLDLQLLEPILLEELNLKKIIFSTKQTHLISYSALPNLPLLGKTWGKYLPQIKEKISLLSQSQLIDIKNGCCIDTTLSDGKLFTFSYENIILSHSQDKTVCAESLGEITLHLDTTITEELYQECVARELINRIQKYRKLLNLSFEQTIDILLSDVPLWVAAFNKHKEFILQETLCKNATFVGNLEQGESIQVEGISGFLHIQHE